MPLVERWRRLVVGPRIWALVDQALQSASNFLMMVLLGRDLPAEQFGVFSLGYLLVLFAMSFHRTAITQPMNLLAGREASGVQQQRYRALLRLHVLWLPGSAVLLLPLGLLLKLDPATLVSTVAFLAAFQLLELQRRSLYSRLRIRLATMLSAIVAASQACVLLLMSGAWLHSAADGLLMLAASCLLAAVVGWLLLARLSTEGVPSMSALQVLREQVQHSRWIIASQVVFWGANQVYPALMAPLGPVMVANFSAGMTILNALNVLKMTLANYLPVRVGKVQAEGGINALAKWVRRTLVITVFAASAVMAMLAIWAQEITYLVYGAKYPEAGFVIQGLSVGMVLSIATVVLNVGAVGVDSSRWIFIANSVATVFTFSAGWWMIRNWGLQGAVIANSIGFAIPALILGAQLWWRFRLCVRK